MDSGARSCLFHASIGEAHGLRLKDGLEGLLGGVVGGAVGKVYYHHVKLALPGHIIPILAGFSPDISVGALLGRYGFFDNFSILFDPSNNPPGFGMKRVGKA